jgi:hypothetical protein
LLAALTQLAGTNAWLLRLPAVLAAVALVPLTVAFAYLLGGSTRAAWLVAIASAAASLVTAMSAALSTSTFEPLAFTAVGYFVTRAILLSEARAFWWAGLVAGLALEAKYGMIFWLLGIALGLALFGDRSVWRSRDFWIGAAIAAILVLPNVVWQLAHGLPFLELVRNDNAGNLTGSPLQFLLDQLFLVNALLGAGAVSLGRVRRDGGACRRHARQRLLSCRRLPNDVRRGCRRMHEALALVCCTLGVARRGQRRVGIAVRPAVAAPRAPSGHARSDELSAAPDGKSVHRSAVGMHFLTGARLGRGRAAHR